MNSDMQATPTDPAVVCGGASAIAAGYFHSLAVVDSCVYAWGAEGDEGRCTVPPAARTDVVDVAAGREFSVALRNDGSLVAWGISSVAGKLVGNLATDVAQVAAGEKHVLVLKKDGHVLSTGTTESAPECRVPEDLSDVVQVAAGEHFSLALKRDGTIVAWGNAGESGRALDVPEALQGHYTKIAAGHYHALAITDTGDVVEWGWTEESVPDGARTGATDIAAGYCFSMARTSLSNGTVYVWGNGDCGQKDLPASLAAGVARIAAGYGHCLALGSGLAPFWLGDSVPGDAYVARDYSGSVSATGMPAVAYAKGGTNWPSWLKLNARTGELSGRPSATSGVVRITISATNAYGSVSNNFDLQVYETPLDPPEFITTSVPTGEVGLPYNFPDQGFRIVAANAAGYYLSRADQYALPAGLVLEEDGLLHGTPVAEDATVFYVMASNATAMAEQQFFISIGPASAAPVILTDSPLDDARLGEAYRAEIETDRAAMFAVAGGRLPEGLGMESATGVISGTPAEYGAFAFTIEAANAAGATEKLFELAVNAAPSIATETLPDGTVGEAYSQTIEAGGWPAPSFAVAGTLPAGLSLDSASGRISGTPTAEGTSSFAITASNAIGSVERNYTVNVVAAAHPAFTNISFTATNVVLQWTTTAPTNTRLWWSTNISAAKPGWKSLGKKKSPWSGPCTNTVPTYYKLTTP